MAAPVSYASNAWREAGAPLNHIRPPSRGQIGAWGGNSGFRVQLCVRSLFFVFLGGMGLTRTMIWLYGHTYDAGWTPVGIGLDHQDQSRSRSSSHFYRWLWCTSLYRYRVLLQHTSSILFPGKLRSIESLKKSPTTSHLHLNREDF